MITREQDEGQQATASEEISYYCISPERLVELNRSLEVLLLTRRCRSCREQPFDVAHPPSVDEQMQHIVECCGLDETFIRPAMPMQEIVFRMLLAQGNRPMSLEAVHYQLTDRWATPGNPMNISQKGLKSILDSDEFYGFRELPPEEAEQV